MGGGQSTPAASTQSTPQKTLTDTPWRKFPHAWNDVTRKALRDKVYGYEPMGYQDKVAHSRIVLMGFVGAGKSSFYNTINSACKIKIDATGAEAGKAAQSVTKMLEILKVRSEKGKALNFRIVDTMGAEIREGLQLKDIPPLLAGKLPHEYDLTRKEDPDDIEGYIQKPTLTEQPHVLVILANIRSVGNADKVTWEKLWTIKAEAKRKKIPVLYILTHIDELCGEVARDLTKVYSSILVRDAVRTVASKMGVPENCVLPMQNYHQDTNNDINLDILALENVRFILDQCQSFLEKKLDD